MTEQGERAGAGDAAALEARAEDFRGRFRRLEEEIARVIVGHQEVVRQVLVAVVAGGHALLEGVPGLGKTLLVRTLAAATRLGYQRIQFTPDLMPADIVGTQVVVEDERGRKRFEFQRGPVFGQVVLADEINRATPKTQSALLEAMQEHAVTASGTRHTLPEPFFVLATQNPIEMEGTYPLPEAQLDRFLYKVQVRPSGADELVEVLRRTTGAVSSVPEAVCGAEDLLAMQALAREVPLAEHVYRYAAGLCLATHPDAEGAPEGVRRFVRYGSSPRGAQALVAGAKVLALTRGRLHASAQDLRDAAHAALRHRVLLNFEGEAEGMKPDAVVDQVLEAVPDVPREVGRLLGAR
ncbi:MAG: AAA family ATPase [Planctomycetes bacterium]|nr:AAA family ATPase [Planctomycetota bacterium]